MSFVDGFSDSTSSTRPVRKIATQVVTSTGDSRATPNSAAQLKQTSAMPTPPNMATGRRFQRSSLGRATRPKRMAATRQIGTRTSDSASATRNGAMIMVNIEEGSGSYQEGYGRARAEFATVQVGSSCSHRSKQTSAQS